MSKNQTKFRAILPAPILDSRPSTAHPSSAPKTAISDKSIKGSAATSRAQENKHADLDTAPRAATSVKFFGQIPTQPDAYTPSSMASHQDLSNIRSWSKTPLPTPHFFGSLPVHGYNGVPSTVSQSSDRANIDNVGKNRRPEASRQTGSTAPATSFMGYIPPVYTNTNRHNYESARTVADEVTKDRGLLPPIQLDNSTHSAHSTRADEHNVVTSNPIFSGLASDNNTIGLANVPSEHRLYADNANPRGSREGTLSSSTKQAAEQNIEYLEDYPDFGLPVTKKDLLKQRAESRLQNFTPKPKHQLVVANNRQYSAVDPTVSNEQMHLANLTRTKHQSPEWDMATLDMDMANSQKHLTKGTKRARSQSPDSIAMDTRNQKRRIDSETSQLSEKARGKLPIKPNVSVAHWQNSEHETKHSIESEHLANGPQGTVERHVPLSDFNQKQVPESMLSQSTRDINVSTSTFNRGHSNPSSQDIARRDEPACRTAEAIFRVSLQNRVLRPFYAQFSRMPWITQMTPGELQPYVHNNSQIARSIVTAKYRYVMPRLQQLEQSAVTRMMAFGSYKKYINFTRASPFSIHAGPRRGACVVQDGPEAGQPAVLVSVGITTASDLLQGSGEEGKKVKKMYLQLFAQDYEYGSAFVCTVMNDAVVHCPVFSGSLCLQTKREDSNEWNSNNSPNKDDLYRFSGRKKKPAHSKKTTSIPSNTSFWLYTDEVPIYDGRPSSSSGQEGFRPSNNAWDHLSDLPRYRQELPAGSVIVAGFTLHGPWNSRLNQGKTTAHFYIIFAILLAVPEDVDEEIEADSDDSGIEDLGQDENED